MSADRASVVPGRGGELTREVNSRRCRRQGRRASGFTLVELMITLSVMAVATAVAAPRFTASLHRYRADAAARRVAADIERARTAARVASASRQLVFDTSTSSYSIAKEKSLDKSSATFRVDLALPPYSVHLQAANFAGNPSLTFDGYGQGNNDGIVQVTSGAYLKTVTFQAATGKTTITP